MSSNWRRTVRSCKTYSISFPAARSEGLLVETVGRRDGRLRQREQGGSLPEAARVGRSLLTQTAGHRWRRSPPSPRDASREPVTEAQVQEAIAQLERPRCSTRPLVGPTNGLSRRQMIGKSAAAAGALGGRLADHQHPRTRPQGRLRHPSRLRGMQGEPRLRHGADHRGSGHCCQTSGQHCNATAAVAWSTTTPATPACSTADGLHGAVRPRVGGCPDRHLPTGHLLLAVRDRLP